MKTTIILIAAISSFLFINSAQANPRYDRDYYHQQQDQRSIEHEYKSQRKIHKAYRKGYRHAVRDSHQPPPVQHVTTYVETHSYRTYRPHHSLLPVFAGALIGGVIAYEMGH